MNKINKISKMSDVLERFPTEFADERNRAALEMSLENVEFTDLIRATIGTFDWRDTTQGGEYWAERCEEMLSEMYIEAVSAGCTMPEEMYKAKYKNDISELKDDEGVALLEAILAQGAPKVERDTVGERAMAIKFLQDMEDNMFTKLLSTEVLPGAVSLMIDALEVHHSKDVKKCVLHEHYAIRRTDERQSTNEEYTTYMGKKPIANIQVKPRGDIGLFVLCICKDEFTRVPSTDKYTDVYETTMMQIFSERYEKVRARAMK